VVTRLVRATPIDFASLRRELELPTQFPLAAQREADEAADAVCSWISDGIGTGEVADRTDIPLVTVDPASARDLDQALCLSRRRSGYRVLYAIADVTAFVRGGGELEAEAWRRGLTVYLPDGKVPLHPVSLSEGAASLLPGQPTPAVLWTIDLDADGAIVAVRVERAIVRSRAKLDYNGVQAAADAGTLDGAIAALPELGRLLIARGLARGAVNLPIAEQEVERDGNEWRLVLRATVAAEEWNAQISLLTGAAAASIMLDGGVGLLRTMPAPRPEALARLRAAAPALGVDWPDAATIGQVIATLDPATPRAAAFVDHAAELMRGAGYTSFAGSPPEESSHGAVGGPYAHVTAPLRRLADRYATEACINLTAGRAVPDWVAQALPLLPEVMQRSDRRASTAERSAIDLAEAVLLAGRVGEEFDAAVIDVDDPPPEPNRGADGAQPDTVDHAADASKPAPTGARASGGMVALDDPPVRARCTGNLPLGHRIRVRLASADPQRRTVMFEAVTRSP
jgi:exoribonuclease R